MSVSSSSYRKSPRERKRVVMQDWSSEDDEVEVYSIHSDSSSDLEPFENLFKCREDQEMTTQPPSTKKARPRKDTPRPKVIHTNTTESPSSPLSVKTSRSSSSKKPKVSAAEQKEGKEVPETSETSMAQLFSCSNEAACEKPTAAARVSLSPKSKPAQSMEATKPQSVATKRSPKEIPSSKPVLAVKPKSASKKKAPTDETKASRTPSSNKSAAASVVAATKPKSAAKKSAPIHENNASYTTISDKPEQTAVAAKPKSATKKKKKKERKHGSEKSAAKKEPKHKHSKEAATKGDSKSKKVKDKQPVQKESSKTAPSVPKTGGESAPKAKASTTVAATTAASDTKKRKAEAITKDDSKATLPPKKKKKKRTFQDQVLLHMLLSCKPFTLKSLAHSLKTTEASLNFVMLSLLDKQLVFKKEFATKTRTKELYWANQEATAKEVTSLLVAPDEMQKAHDECRVLQQENVRLARELSLVEKEPSNVELDAQIAQMEESVRDANGRLQETKARIQEAKSSSKGGTCPRRLKKRINAMRDEWKNRKVKCMDFVDQLADGMEKKVKDVVKLLDLETDEMEGVVLPPKQVIEPK